MGDALTGIRTILRYSCAALVLLTLGVHSAAAFPAGDTDPLNLAAFRGKVVYVDFWASWCASCRKSFPWMNHLQQQFGAEGLVVIAVNVDHDRMDADQFLSQYAPAFQVSFDPKGAVAERFQVVGMPASFLIDRSGRLALRHDGFRSADRDRLEQQIQSLLTSP